METDDVLSPPFGNERRRHPRFLVKLPLEYRRDNDPIMHPGHTVNFSGEGFMLSVSEHMDIGEKLELKIYFSLPSRLITIATIVKIAWVDSKDRDNGYRVGVSFVSISPADKEKLKGFLNLYGDPHQVPSELKSPPGSLLPPCKLPRAGNLGPAPVANPSTAGFFERFLSRAKRAIGKFVGI